MDRNTKKAFEHVEKVLKSLVGASAVDALYALNQLRNFLRDVHVEEPPQ